MHSRARGHVTTLTHQPLIASSQEECASCRQDKVTTCNMPYAAKLLVQELMAMGIKVVIKPKL